MSLRTSTEHGVFSPGHVAHGAGHVVSGHALSSLRCASGERSVPSKRLSSTDVAHADWRTRVETVIPVRSAARCQSCAFMEKRVTSELATGRVALASDVPDGLRVFTRGSAGDRPPSLTL